MLHHNRPELELPYVIHDVLNAARFRVVPDSSDRAKSIVGNTIYPIVVLSVQTEYGGFLTRDYLDRHSIAEESLIAFLEQKGCGALREHYLPSLRCEHTRVDISVYTRGNRLWYTVIIRHCAISESRVVSALRRN
jgi:hypothetical protein